MKSLCLVMTLLTFVAVPSAIAVEPNEVLTDPALEARARALSKELRCMVCQNQSIDDSEAPLARDLRILVRERLQAGESDRQVIDFLVARYGEFVLLRPRFSWHTALLWFGPAAMLLIGHEIGRTSRRVFRVWTPRERPQHRLDRRVHAGEVRRTIGLQHAVAADRVRKHRG